MRDFNMAKWKRGFDRIKAQRPPINIGTDNPNGKATHSDLFEGIGGTFKMIRWDRYRPTVTTKIELYKIHQGLEMFIGYVPINAWRKRNSCQTCGAAPHQPCVATGAVTTKGAVMGSVHACRRRD